jgi:hypothetical protein
MALLPMGLMFLSVALVFFVIGKLTADFVLPIMFLRGGMCRTAWAEFLGLMSVNIGRFVLYLLFQIVLGLAILVIVVIAVVVTCCIAGCLLIIPYLSTVLLLPVLVFKRSYSLYYFAQYGPPYDAFPPLTPPQPATGGSPV